MPDVTIDDLTEKTTLEDTDLFELEDPNISQSRKSSLLNMGNRIFNAKDTDDLTEGATNLYYTDTRVSANSDVVANTAKVGVTTQISNIVEDTTPELGGSLDCLNNNLENIKVAEFNDWVDNGNSGVADTIDFTTGTGQKSTLTDDVTYTLTDPISTTGWARLQLKVIQDATGGHDITWPANVYWDSSEPTWTDGTANQLLYITLLYDAELDEYTASATTWRS